MNQKFSDIQYVPSIGLFTINRPIFDHVSPTGRTLVKGSCTHRTTTCEAECYNVKFYEMWPSMAKKDYDLDYQWANLDAENIADELESSNQTRFRLCSRGEPFADHTDIERVESLLTAAPDVLFWTPTRSWRDPLLRIRVHDLAVRHTNFIPLASLDESNTNTEFADLKRDGWPTMWFGPAIERDRVYGGDPLFKCPKTYRGLSGHCAICRAGCFAPRMDSLFRRVDVDLGAGH